MRWTVVLGQVRWVSDVAKRGDRSHAISDLLSSCLVYLPLSLYYIIINEWPCWRAPSVIDHRTSHVSRSSSSQHHNVPTKHREHADHAKARTKIYGNTKIIRETLYLERVISLRPAV